MLDLEFDKSGSGDNQGSDDNNQPDELAKAQAQLSASSNESKLLNETNKVLISDDFAYFQELIVKDKTMAERVIEKVAKMKGRDPDDIRKLLLGTPAAQNMSPYEIEQKVKDTIAKQEGEKALEEFIEKVGLTKDKDLNEEFQSNFEEYMQGKDYTAANVRKFSKAAFRDLNEDKVKSFEKKKSDVEAQINAGGGSGKNDAKKTEGRQLLKSASQNDW